MCLSKWGRLWEVSPQASETHVHLPVPRKNLFWAHFPVSFCLVDKSLSVNVIYITSLLPPRQQYEWFCPSRNQEMTFLSSQTSADENYQQCQSWVGFPESGMWFNARSNDPGDETGTYNFSLCCVTLGKSLSSSGPWFLYTWSETILTTSL